MTRFMTRSSFKVLLLSAVFALAYACPIQSFAQSDPSKPAPPMTIEELEAMKARINQLEAELKAKQAAEAPAAAPAEAPASSASTPLMGIGSAGGSAPVGAAPPDTMTPFADFDWTWMNGN